MAAMVARGSGSLSTSVPVQEKGSRNKRKFRAEPPLVDPDKLPLNQPNCPNYELAPVESVSSNHSVEHHASVCDVCKTLAYGLRQEVALEEFQDADWVGATETQLEELLLGNLDMIFRNAVKKITSCGYSEDEAMNAMLRSGVCHGCKDTASNIADHALAYLASRQDVNSSPRENLAEGLQKLEKSVLTEMVSVLREVRPFFSIGDAMWRLLICDMDVSRACEMDSDPLSSMGNDEAPCDASVPQSKSESESTSSTLVVPESNVSGPSMSNPMLSNPQPTPKPEMSPVIALPNLPSEGFSASINPQGGMSSLNSGKESSVSPSYHVVEESSSLTISQSVLSEVRPTGGRRGHGGNSKRETIHRQKSIHFEKSYRAHGSRSTLRSGKINSLNGLILDKKSKSISDSSSISIKSASVKVSKSLGSDKIQTDATLNLSFKTGTSASSSTSSKAVAASSPLPTANTELSLSLPAKSAAPSLVPASTNPNCSCIDATNSGSYAMIPFDKNRQWVPQDEKDELMLKLFPRIRELQAQLQEWSDWAQQKVMQAARRLSKDKAELQTLRQEKEEAARIKKEKQSTEENTLKKIHEMENALVKTTGQLEKSNASVRRLEVENAQLRQEMEAAKIRAEESAANCQEVLMREMVTLKKFQSWEKQKALSQKELTDEKRAVSQLQHQLEQAKEHFDQIEAKRKQEEKVKEGILLQSESERKEREQIEASAKLKEDSIRSKAEADLWRYKDDIRRLEHEIAKLRLTMDSSKMTALNWGLDSKARTILEMMDTQDLGAGDVQRDRECVMCLTEEISVVFLPCAHQVVCTKCNELHQKQGMKECPSCRTPIHRRISVRSADS